MFLFAYVKMESVLSASTAKLINSLDYSGPNAPIADYVTSRQQIQVFASGSNTYSPQGVKQMRFNIGTQAGAFCDLSSLALQCTFTNNSTTQSCTVLGPSIGALLQEARIYLGNIECDRVTYYSRTEALLSRFLSADKRAQLFDEGFGFSAGSLAGNDFVAAAVPASTSKTVIWRPQALGLCNNKNLIPTAFIPGGLVLEFLLANTSQECVDSSGSSDWTLSDAKILLDVVNVDPGFLTSLSKFLLNNGTLTLNTKNYATTMFSVNSPSMTLQHVRSFTRLNSFFLTFFKSETNTQKQLNTFYLSPQGQNISVQAQIGEKQLPDNRVDNLSQHYHRLLHTIGVANSASTINITRGPYASDSFISGTDCEAVPGEAHGSGLSTMNAPLVLDIQNLGTSSSDLPTSAFLLCFHETLIQVSQDGVQVAI